MKVGLIPPRGFFGEFDDVPPDRAWTRILDIIRLAEKLGFESVWFGEHVIAKWDRHGTIFDCFTMATAAAAVVPRIAVGFVVLNSTFRNPALTAKMAATLDAVSGGRLVLGLGAGFKESEAQAIGVPFPDMPERMAILAEHFEIVSQLTRAGADPRTIEGRHARIADLTGAPHGVQLPGIPLLIGGHGKNVTYRLAAKYCDEINIDVPRADMPDHLGVLRDRCDEIGRDPATLAVAASLNASFPWRGLRVTGRHRMMRQEDLPSVMTDDLSALGSRSEELTAWREMGIDRIMCGTPGLADTDESLYELVDDLRLAGIELDPGVPGATRPATGSWIQAIRAGSAA